jgi:hypothetical protein
LGYFRGVPRGSQRPTAKFARILNKRGDMNIKRGHFWTKWPNLGLVPPDGPMPPRPPALTQRPAAAPAARAHTPALPTRTRARCCPCPPQPTAGAISRHRPCGRPQTTTRELAQATSTDVAPSPARQSTAQAPPPHLDVCRRRRLEKARRSRLVALQARLRPPPSLLYGVLESSSHSHEVCC